MHENLISSDILSSLFRNRICYAAEVFHQLCLVIVQPGELGALKWWEPQTSKWLLFVFQFYSQNPRWDWAPSDKVMVSMSEKLSIKKGFTFSTDPPARPTLTHSSIHLRRCWACGAGQNSFKKELSHVVSLTWREAQLLLGKCTDTTVCYVNRIKSISHKQLILKELLFEIDVF